jgi:hypothetical protein
VVYLIIVCNAAFKQAADMSILASWYREQENNNSPVVVIIDDMERCCGSVLSDFILMLRYSCASCHPSYKCFYISLFVCILFCEYVYILQIHTFMYMCIYTSAYTFLFMYMCHLYYAITACNLLFDLYQ